VQGGDWAWVSERDLEFRDFSWGVGLELVSYFVSGLIALKGLGLHWWGNTWKLIRLGNL
jgi:hypothetical protein